MLHMELTSLPDSRHRHRRRESRTPFPRMQANALFHPQRGLTDVEKEWVGASTSCGALFGGLLGGNLADKIGRKWVLAVSRFSSCVEPSGR